MRKIHITTSALTRNPVTNDLYGKFRSWVSDFSYHESVTNNNAFNSQMAEIAKKGMVSDKRRLRVGGRKRPWGYVKLKGYDSENDPTFDESVQVSDLDRDFSNNTDEEQASARVLDIRRKIKRRLS